MADFIVESLLPGLNSLLSFAFLIYNSLAGMAAGMLGQDPASWNGSGWSIVEGVNTVFLGIGGILVCIFFLMGFCSDSLDIRQDFRLENILRMFIKLCVAEFFVVNSLTLVRSFFSFATGIIKKLSGSGVSFEYGIPGDVALILEDPTNNGISGWEGIGWTIILYILGILFLLIISGCGIMILYEAFQRFFKILLLVPYGTLANSTLAGNHTLSRSAESFWKYAFATIFEAVTMYMALALGAAVVTSGAVSLTVGMTGALYVLGWMLESSFVCMIMVGTVKGAETITQKALGL